MTWEEFKQHVEREMSKEGIEHNCPIWIIDVLHPDSEVVVTCDTEGELMIYDGPP